MAKRPQQSGNKLDVLQDPIIDGGDKPKLIDDRMRDMRTDFANTILESHYATGEFKVPYGTQADRPASPKDGDLFLNFSKGKLEIWINTAVNYTGTDGIVTGAAPTVVTSALSLFLTRVHCGAGVDFYFDADGSGSAVELDTVDGNTQVTLKSAYAATPSRDGLAHNFTIRLQTAGQWVEVDKILQEAFEMEHSIRKSDTVSQPGRGEHAFSIKTDDTDLANVKSGQLWFDTGGGKNRAKFRDGSTTRVLTQGDTFVWLATPVSKVALTNFATLGFTNIDISADSGADTAKAAIFQIKLQTGVAPFAPDANTVTAGVLKFRKNGTALDTPNVEAMTVQISNPTASQLGASLLIGGGQLFVPVDGSEICQYGATLSVGSSAAIQYQIVLVGYVK